MFYVYRSQTDETRLKQPIQSTDYLKLRLRRMVRSVLKNELEAGNSCPMTNILTKKGQHVFIKRAWLTFFGLCFAMFTYQTYDRISHYFTYPVAVDVFIINNALKKFPEMTICFLETDAIFELMDKYNMSCNIPIIKVMMDNTVGLKTEEIWKKINSSRALLSALEIHGTKIIPLEYTHESLCWGTCTTFRSSDSNKATQKGDHYFKVTFKKSFHRCATTYTGIYVHDHGDFPMLRRMHMFPTAMNADIAMTNRKFLFVNRRTRPCVSSVVLRECMNNCFIKFIFQMGATKCRFPFYPLKINNISNDCITSSDTAANWLTFREFMNGASGTVCRCARKCEHTTFGERQVTHDVRANTSTTILRYDSPYETLVKERLCYDLIELFCDIGGNSGLFIGVSLLSLFQLGHVVAQSSKKRSQFSIMDPLYKKVLKTFTILKKQGHLNSPLLRMPNSRQSNGLWTTVFKLLVLVVCVCLLMMSVVNRVSHFFQYPMQTIVDITFNMSLEAPTVILCPGDQHVMNLQRKVGNVRNIPDPCDVKVWELFDLPGVNYTDIWPMHATKPKEELKGNRKIHVYPHVPFYDGKCIDLNNGVLTRAPNSIDFFMGKVSHQCGTYYQNAYIISSTGHVDYHRYLQVAYDRGQQITFIFKEIHIDEVGLPCVSSEEHEQCFRNCLKRKLFYQINCRLPYMPAAAIPMCNSSSSVRQAHLEFRNLFFASENTKDCNCLPKCRTRFLEFSHFIEEREIPLTWFSFGPSHNIVESYVVQRAYSLVKLLCDIGGLLGSTLGLCLLGIMETALSFVANHLNGRGRRLNTCMNY